MKISKRHKLALVCGIVAVGLVTGAGSCEDDYNEQRGLGDAPVGKANDSPAYIVNMPNGYMNVAIRCVGGNGIYGHTREAAPTVIPNDPLCAEGGFYEKLDLSSRPDRNVKP